MTDTPVVEPLSLHHIALGARNVEVVAAFYRTAFGLPELTRHYNDDGTLRSVWLGCSAGITLMIEATQLPLRPTRKGVDSGLFLLAFRIPADERSTWETRLANAGSAIEQRTAATSYARDPEGNRIAVSFYPLVDAPPSSPP